jgi:hypothetical protein
MTRIIYGAPPSNTPAGGVKVIYRHSEILNHMGISSAVWHPGDENFKCSWFENNIRTITAQELSPQTDVVIVPEIWASSYVPMLKGLGFRVAIFVQNCYYTHVNLNPSNPNAIADAYRNADLILSISQDTSEYLINIFKVPEEKVILQRYSINASLFRPGNKSKTITYMPRKMEQHSVRVVSALRPLLPEGWSIKALDKMTETQIATNLADSIIFLAFSEFEGLPVPPVEAALSGNIVIGYHGQGGREYWLAPNFIQIEQGDIQGFIKNVLDTIEKIGNNKLEINNINNTMQTIQNYFSSNNEIHMLKQFLNKVQTIK